MMITAKIIKDSISNEGIRLTTIHCRYPRLIHSEFMTHRVFSRNGRSSRAVPVATLLKEENYIPHFLMNKPGMSAEQELPLDSFEEAVAIWNDLIAYTKNTVKRLNELKVHKQHANRPLEWFGYIDVLVSSTEWANFFALRDEVGAQPEIQLLAKAIREALHHSMATPLKPGEWHLPYISNYDDINIFQFIERKEAEGEIVPSYEEILKRVSVARCARLSYKPFDGNGSIEKELERYSLLMESRPVHASPAEHIATPDVCHDLGQDGKSWARKYEWGNFYGWRQFRKMIPHNTIKDR